MNKMIEIKDILNTIHQGDCLEFMKTLPDKCIDLCLTDPPYGIEYKGGFPNSQNFEAIINDKVNDIDFKLLLSELCRVSKEVIIFGANNFYKDLPHKGSWICWDKRCNSEADKLFGAKFELAWLNRTNQGSGGVSIYRIQHAGVRNADGEGQKRFHPTQKPVKLFGNILNDYSNENDIIFDPFMGSGTTAVAARQLGRNFIGCEINKEYCEIIKRRLAQDSLF